MRFSIRDLLWLMAVVALAATIYADRVQRRRQAQKWAAEKSKFEQDSAAALAVTKAKADGLRQQNTLLQHHLVVLLEKQRQRDEEDAKRQRPVPIFPSFRLGPPPPIPNDAESNSLRP